MQEYTTVYKENYLIDVKNGTLFSLKSNKFLGSIPDEKHPYIQVGICVNGKVKNYFLHRLIWEIVHGEIPKRI